MSGYPHTSSRLGPAYKCLSIGANALCAGGVFTLPLLSPALVSRYQFTQWQLTTIVLAGVVGQYPLAPVVGRINDRHGPHICSLVAALSYALSFGGFAFEVSGAPGGHSHPPFSSFRLLAFYSLTAGFGTVFSYYSSLFTASKTFPEYIGIASGTTMALFGLSPLFLTTIGSQWFTDPLGNLNPVNYMVFLATLTGFVHLAGAVALREPIQERAGSYQALADESTALLYDRSLPQDSTALRSCSPLKDSSFWLLGCFCLFNLGAAEMVISNIGTIILALPPHDALPHFSPSNSTARQVQLLSISNTAIRVVTGVIADFVSPAMLPTDNVPRVPRKHLVSRVLFLSWPSLLLALTFLFGPSVMKSQREAWVLSLGVGMSYGAIFTILPSIVSAIWGINDLGSNFGILMMAPFAGTPLFSYIYAFVSQSHTKADGVCIGRSCWLLTFRISAGTSLISLALTIILWQRWKGRL